jgi:hypothetical protein
MCHYTGEVRDEGKPQAQRNQGMRRVEQTAAPQFLA